MAGGITSAQMNLQFCLAVMALEGDAFADQFTGEKIREPGSLGSLEFIKKVEVIADKELDDFGPNYRHAIDRRVGTNDADFLSKRLSSQKEGQENPLSFEQVKSKFKRLAAKVLAGQRAENLYKTILKIEDISSIGELIPGIIP